MERIASFCINHDTLTEGMYLSRVDGDVITYDVRFVRPNTPPYLPTDAMHTIEHLAATYLRNHKEFGPKIIYFGPMGCRTGFYLILKGERSSKEIVPLITELFNFVANFEGEVPGASARDCGNYLDMNLPMAKYLAKSLEGVNEVTISKSVDSNAVFAICPTWLSEELNKKHYFYVWDEETNEVRWMCSFNTRKEDIDEFVEDLKSIISSHK
mgnify:CR=1 FL=1